MDEYCNWCEDNPAERMRDKSEICTACDERLDLAQADEEERNMTRRERAGWIRAQIAGVD